MKEQPKKQLMIDKIQRGVVIDHITQGKAVTIAHLLGLDTRAAEFPDPIAIGVNFESRMGLKDFIKAANLELTPEQLAVVALLAPLATINIISNYEVVQKFKVPMPDEVISIVVCPDQFCVTNQEPVKSRFRVVNQKPLTLRCHYCETEFYDKLIKFR